MTYMPQDLRAELRALSPTPRWQKYLAVALWTGVAVAWWPL